MLFSALYHGLPSTEHVEFDEQDEKDLTWSGSKLGQHKPLSNYILPLILVLSLLLNAVALLFSMRATPCSSFEPSSPFGAIPITALLRQEALISLSQLGFNEI